MTQGFYTAVCMWRGCMCVCLSGRDSVGFYYKYQVCQYYNKLTT